MGAVAAADAVVLPSAACGPDRVRVRCVIRGWLCVEGTRWKSVTTPVASVPYADVPSAARALRVAQTAVCWFSSSAKSHFGAGSTRRTDRIVFGRGCACHAAGIVGICKQNKTRLNGVIEVTADHS